MSQKKGICKNYGECDLADEKIIQERDSSEEFICENPQCRQRLYELEPPKPPKPPIGWIILGVVLIVIIVVVILLMKNRGIETEPLALTLNKTNVELEVTDADTLGVTVTPDGTNVSISWLSDNEEVATVTNGIVTAKTVGEARVIIVAKTETEELRDTCIYTVLPKSNGGTILVPEPEPITPEAGDSKKTPNPSTTSTTLEEGYWDLGYATYQGTMKNGKPHGNHNTMDFKERHLVPGTSTVYAEAGEKVIGNFRNGKLNDGTLHRKSGNIVSVREGQ